jgi:hypothetical protein
MVEQPAQQRVSVDGSDQVGRRRRFGGSDGDWIVTGGQRQVVLTLMRAQAMAVIRVGLHDEVGGVRQVANHFR